MERTWSGTVDLGTTVLRPRTLAEAREAVTAHRRVRPVGSRHTFNRLSVAPGALLDLGALAAEEPQLDADARTVRVPAALGYGRLGAWLDERGWALPSLASIPDLAVAGAVATATHGSGIARQALSAQVSGLELVMADGGDRELTRAGNGDLLDGAVVSLGALGAVHHLTLDVVPRFDVRQTAYGPLPLAAVADRFDEVVSAGETVACFTTLDPGPAGGPVVEQVWVGDRVPARDPAAERFGLERAVPAAPADVLGAPPLVGDRHPVPGEDPAVCAPQGGAIGPWHEMLPHFRAGATPSSGGREIQSEYLVPRPQTRRALVELARIAPRIAPLVQVVELRTVAPDLAWMSPFYRSAATGIHITWTRDVAAVDAALPLLEEAFGALGGRPHWGKAQRADPARVRGLYPRREDFVDLVRDWDPQGRFSTPFVEDVLRRG